MSCAGHCCIYSKYLQGLLNLLNCLWLAQDGDHLHKCSSFEDVHPHRHVCSYCGVWATSAHNLDLHRDSAAHKARVSWLDPGSSPLPPVIKCTLCHFEGSGLTGIRHFKVNAYLEHRMHGTM